MDQTLEDISSLQMSDEEMRLFSGFIEKQSGLQFLDARSALEVSLLSRLQACSLDNYLEYYDLLIRDDPKRQEFRNLLELLTINETSFFRNMPHFEALQKVILPSLFEARQDERKIRIWSAGCATGEEPYSIAMALQDIVTLHENRVVDIQATDISQKALWAAENGIYSERALRNLPDEYREKYFSPVPEKRFELRKDIRDRVTFTPANLIQDPAPFAKSCDIIFCRNVIIYFRKRTIRAILESFYNALADDGYLFVGHSENLSQFTKQFLPIQVHDTFVYTKNIPGKNRKGSTRLLSRRSTEGKAAEIEKSDSLSPEEQLFEARTALEKEDYHRAEEYLRSLVICGQANEEAHALLALVLASTSREDEAFDQAEIALEKNYLFVEAHYIHGLIRRTRGELKDAVQSFTRAIYSDNRFPLAHFQLGGIRQQQGDFKQAERFYQNTLRSLDEPLPDSWLAYFAGFPLQVVHKSCQSSLATCKRMQKRKV